jgi:hypothetical protein
MSKRQGAYCSTCEKFLPKPKLRLECRGSRDHVRAAEAAILERVLKRCKHPRAKWNDQLLVNRVEDPRRMNAVLER